MSLLGTVCVDASVPIGDTGTMHDSTQKDALSLQIPEWVRQKQRQKVSPEGTCLRWQGAAFRGVGKNYGRFKYGGKSFMAHRAMLIWHTNGAPPYHIVLHTCGNQWCVNVKHLRWGTPKENGEDYARHQKYGPGMPKAVDRLRHRFARAWQAWHQT